MRKIPTLFVWHGKGGKMAKIKLRDFGLRRGVR